MLVGIMSDSHDNLPAIRAAVDLFHRRNVEAVLHAGDLVAPFTAKELLRLRPPLHIVFGNNDGERLGLKQVFGDRIHVAPYKLNLGGKNVLLLHEPDNLDAIADSGHFDAIIYGHLHEVDIRKGRTLVINPGECGGWLSGRCTVALWDTENGSVEVVDLPVQP
jgi:hypothetical protein